MKVIILLIMSIFISCKTEIEIDKQDYFEKFKLENRDFIPEVLLNAQFIRNEWDYNNLKSSVVRYTMDNDSISYIIIIFRDIKESKAREYFEKQYYAYEQNRYIITNQGLHCICQNMIPLLIHLSGNTDRESLYRQYVKTSNLILREINSLKFPKCTNWMVTQLNGYDTYFSIEIMSSKEDDDNFDLFHINIYKDGDIEMID